MLKDKDIAVELSATQTKRSSCGYRAWLKAGFVFSATVGTFALAKTIGVCSWASGIFSTHGDGDGTELEIKLQNTDGERAALSCAESAATQAIWQSPVVIESLTGVTGFMLVADGQLGYSVNRAGDVNGDKIDDFIISSPCATSYGNIYAGQSYVVFGNNGTWSSVLDLTILNGINGFIVNGGAAGDQIGWAVSQAGDINGDSFTDLIIGAPYKSPDGNVYAGQSYVIFGHDGIWDSNFNLTTLNGANGFIMDGEAAYDQFGYAVSQAGDINGDSFTDLIIGAPFAAPDGINAVGEAYVIFGHNDTWVDIGNLTALIETKGVTLEGEMYYANYFDGPLNGQLGYAVGQAGDINGDKIYDIIIGAHYASPNRNTYAGRSYVIFGHNGTWHNFINLTTLNGANGFIMDGEVAGDQSGASLSCADDINGDGFDDFIIGAPYALSSAGRSYVIFGHNGTWNRLFNLATLNGVNGFILDGEVAGDQFGSSVNRAGDINGDNIGDIIIGAPYASSKGLYKTGKSYVVFGHNGTWNRLFNLATLDGANGFILAGGDTGRQFGTSVSLAGDINGDNVDDLIIGAPGIANSANQSYVVFGQYTSEFRVGTLLASQTGCCTAYIGRYYNFTFIAESFIALNPAVITYEMSTIPENSDVGWLSLNSTTRTIAGTPLNATSIGTLNLKVMANYGLLTGVSQTFALDIIAL